MQKPSVKLPLQIWAPRACTEKTALKYKVKQSKNGKITSETYKPQGLFLEFYGITYPTVQFQMNAIL